MPGVGGEKGWPETRGLFARPGLARGGRGDVNEVGVAVRLLPSGDRLLPCWGGATRLGMVVPGADVPPLALLWCRLTSPEGCMAGEQAGAAAADKRLWVVFS